MNSELKEWIQTCETCREFENSQPNETLMCHDVPDRKWQKVGVDLFSLDGKDYMVTTGYRSNFWEVDCLTSTTSRAVILKLKPHFMRYGIPDTVMSDNGPQFVSEEFRRFSRSWGFNHITSSLHHSRSNGKAESSVKAAKRMIKKAQKSGEDQYFALLNIHNTPSQGTDTSPAQRLPGRRTKTIVPTTRYLLDCQVNEQRLKTKSLKHMQDRQSTYYNRSATDLPVLRTGETVRMKPFKLGDKTWKKGKVIERLDERSYEVEDEEGASYRRNRVHLRKSHTKPPTVLHDQPVFVSPEDVSTSQPVLPKTPNKQESVTPPSTVNPRRSSRTNKANLPAKFTDYQM